MGITNSSTLVMGTADGVPAIRSRVWESTDHRGEAYAAAVVSFEGRGFEFTINAPQATIVRAR